ncbi:MAG: NHL repeat-containing protein [Chthoniobacterales bacterium]
MKSPFALLAALGLATTAHAASFQNGQAADAVLGQPDFTTDTSVAGQPNRFSNAEGVAWDPATGKVFVADAFNNRVLRFSSAAAAQVGAFPEAVFGQQNFSAHAANQGGASPTASTLNFPFDLCVDGLGRLWVADLTNNRVLGFYLASYLTNDPPADIVLGQASFTTATAGTTAATMKFPGGVSVGPGDTLWVADTANNRVLRFDNITNKTVPATANGVLGQPDFTTATAGNTQGTLRFPYALWADTAGRLWVSDTDNYRVLRFDDAATKVAPATADGVLGQPDFTANAVGSGAAQMSDNYGICLDAAGTLWVSDYSNRRVVGFPSPATLPNGSAATLVLGEPDFATTTGGHTARLISGPSQVAPGPGGSLFVVDYGNCRVLRFSPAAAPAPTPRVAVSGKKKLTTIKAKLAFKGTATNAARVEVKVGSAAYKPAAGAASWRFTAKLPPGKTTILVRAVSSTGATSAPVKITVTRS